MHLPSAQAVGTNAPPHLGESPEESYGHQGEEGGGVDYISRLPDAILGEIISLLPTKAGARTQTLASRWRRLWLSSPLNIDLSNHAGDKALPTLVSRILGAHAGPARRFSIRYLRDRNWCPATVDAWLQSPALDNLQELELDIWSHSPRLPPSTFRFSATLHVVTISGFSIADGMVETILFPQLTKLGLQRVNISQDSLHSIIAGCPVIECLLLQNVSCGSDASIRINSPSLISFGFDLCLRELVIEDAPSLKRLFQLSHRIIHHVLVISAPNLETVGSIYQGFLPTKFAFGDMVIQELRAVNFTTGLSSVKTLAIDNRNLDLELVINLLQCFPHLENLYIKTSDVSGSKNLWRRKYHNGHIKYPDMRLKTIVLKNYRGIKSQASFATFFILNAKMLLVMRFEGGPYMENAKFIARQQRLLQLEKRASRGAQFQFTTTARICYFDLPHIYHVHDLSKADPFKCTC